MVCETEKPNLRAASCCKVEVVNGGAGDFLAGLVTILATSNFEDLHASRNLRASSLLLKRCCKLAFTIAGLPECQLLKTVH